MSTPAHTVEWKIDDAGIVTPKFFCHAVSGSRCLEKVGETEYCSPITWFGESDDVMEFHYSPSTNARQDRPVDGPIEVLYEPTRETWIWRYPIEGKPDMDPDVAMWAREFHTQLFEAGIVVTRESQYKRFKEEIAELGEEIENPCTTLTLQESQNRVAEEMADVILSLHVLALSHGIKLNRAIAAKIAVIANRPLHWEGREPIRELNPNPFRELMEYLKNVKETS